MGAIYRPGCPGDLTLLTLFFAEEDLYGSDHCGCNTNNNSGNRTFSYLKINTVPKPIPTSLETLLRNSRTLLRGY